VFDADWLQQRLGGELPAIEARGGAGSALPEGSWPGALGLTLMALVVGGLLYRRATRPRLLSALCIGAALLATFLGIFYDQVRALLHDHGDSPERSLFLLTPLGLGALLRTLLRRVAGDSVLPTEGWAAWFASTAGCSLLVTFWLLLPTAYYYGARRAVVLAASLALVMLVANSITKAGWSRRVAAGVLALTFALAVLLGFYQVRQLGPAVASAATWALDAAIYTHFTWVGLVVAKLVLFRLFVMPESSQRPLDAAGAAALFSTCILIELADARLPRETFACVFAACLLGWFAVRRQARSSLFGGGLLLLEHLYTGDMPQIAGIEMLLAGMAATLFGLRRLRLDALAFRYSVGLSLVVALYLMLWPTVGFHLVGVDFRYMFQWVPAAASERWWWVVALGFLLKLSLPLMLVVSLARDDLDQVTAEQVVAPALAAKLLLLSITVTAYAATHAMNSQQSTAMLAELLLLAFLVPCALLCMAAGRLGDRVAARVRWPFRHAASRTSVSARCGSDFDSPRHAAPSSVAR
jgi:hypothetical protein